ncbi:MAG: site-2 protease family protein, partial [Oscillospiraceae bacterium]|nr:site-2 protease family protein [Oscillospiraceae bacterium]
LLTINLGIFNLLPIPALDGGRLFFMLIELIFRKPVPPEKEGMIHAIGMLLLFALIIFVSFNDIIRLLGR